MSTTDPLSGNVQIAGGNGAGSYSSTGSAVNMTASTAIGAGTILVSPGTWGQVYVTSSVPQSKSPKLPPIMMYDRDENHALVTITLAPEQGVSAHEALKLTMLIISYCQSADNFSALGYIRANNLERHFKFSS